MEAKVEVFKVRIGAHGVGEIGTRVITIKYLKSIFRCSKATVVVSWLLRVPATGRVYLREGSASTMVRAATLRQKVHIKLAVSSAHSILTPGQGARTLILQPQASDMVETRVNHLRVTDRTRQGSDPGISCTRGGRLTTWPPGRCCLHTQMSS